MCAWNPNDTETLTTVGSQVNERLPQNYLGSNIWGWPLACIQTRIPEHTQAQILTCIEHPLTSMWYNSIKPSQLTFAFGFGVLFFVLFWGEQSLTMCPWLALNSQRAKYLGHKIQWPRTCLTHIYGLGFNSQHNEKGEKKKEYTQGSTISKKTLKLF